MSETNNVVTLNAPQEQLTHNSRFRRTFLGAIARSGVSKPEAYIQGLLLTGQAHHFYGPADCGKSWLAMWASAESVLIGRPVIYFDLENGPEVVKERMVEALEVSPEALDAHMYYYPFVELTTDRESREGYVSLLEEFTEQGLIVFDSWLGFLSQAGLKEDSNDDLESWAKVFLNAAASRGWTVILLDHTGHNGDHARGASRKSQVVQVQYQVKKKSPFDRISVGTLELERKKDRLAWLPEKVSVQLGNTPFVFERQYDSGSGDGSDYLPAQQYTALKALGTFGIAGARNGVWEEKSRLSHGSFDRARKALLSKGYVVQEGKTYRLTESGKQKAFSTTTEP
jgi:hypothetical protein